MPASFHFTLISYPQAFTQSPSFVDKSSMSLFVGGNKVAELIFIFHIYTRALKLFYVGVFHRPKSFLYQMMPPPPHSPSSVFFAFFLTIVWICPLYFNHHFYLPLQQFTNSIFVPIKKISLPLKKMNRKVESI